MEMDEYKRIKKKEQSVLPTQPQDTQAQMTVIDETEFSDRAEDDIAPDKSGL